MEETQQAADLQQRLKASVWYTVGKICNEEANYLTVTVTPQFIATLSEVVYKQAEILAADLEHFAKHAKRPTTITIEDVKLCARRNDALHDLITEEANKFKKPHAEQEPKKKKK